MKIIAPLCFLFNLAFTTEVSQNFKPCDLTKEVNITGRLEKYTYAQIEGFICTISEECEKNIEFIEVANERLFEVLKAYPKTTIRVINTCEESKRNLILSYLENPVHDGVEIESLIGSLSSLDSNTPFLDQILASLKKAALKMK